MTWFVRGVSPRALFSTGASPPSTWRRHLAEDAKDKEDQSRSGSAQAAPGSFPASRAEGRCLRDQEKAARSAGGFLKGVSSQTRRFTLRGGRRLFRGQRSAGGPHHPPQNRPPGSTARCSEVRRGRCCTSLGVSDLAEQNRLCHSPCWSLPTRPLAVRQASGHPTSAAAFRLRAVSSPSPWAKATSTAVASPSAGLPTPPCGPGHRGRSEGTAKGRVDLQVGEVGTQHGPEMLGAQGAKGQGRRPPSLPGATWGHGAAHGAAAGLGAARGGMARAPQGSGQLLGRRRQGRRVPRRRTAAGHPGAPLCPLRSFDVNREWGCSALAPRGRGDGGPTGSATEV